MSTKLEVNPYEYVDAESTSLGARSDQESPIVAFGPVLFEDFLHAHNFKLRTPRKIGVCIVFVCLAVIVLLTRGQFASQALPGLIILGVMTVFCYFSSKASVRKAFEASGKVRRWWSSHEIGATARSGTRGNGVPCVDVHRTCRKTRTES